LRIAVVNSIRVCGGGEKWLVRQGTCWRERGHEVLIVCHPQSGLEQLVGESGLAAAPVRMPHDLSLRAAAGIRGVLHRFRPDVVLCCNERAFRLTVPATRWAGSPPLVYRNGLTATFKNRWVNRLLFRRTERMVVISEPLREEMASYGWIPSNRLQVIRNGIDPAPYAPDPAARDRVRRDLDTPRDAVVAAVLARVTEDKGQVETIEAMAALARKHPRAMLWIVGEGSLRPRLEAQAQQRGIADRVRFPGFRKDIAAVLQAVDIVVQASHREGLGNTLLEAMAAARPVVASSVGGILDVVVPGETGELVPPYDAAALAPALESLLADPEKRRRYGENGRRRVEHHFRLTRETDEWCRLFDQVAGRFTTEMRRHGVVHGEGTGEVVA
jgi:glycosyltransferase involved in cell wall biosynthesis